MGLFNNFPYTDLHNLNLDWVIMKLKDVDKAQTAAQDVLEMVTRAETAATSADEDAATASSAATAAAASQAAAYTSEQNAWTYQNAAQVAMTEANQAAGNAHDAMFDAQAARDTAVSAADDAAEADTNTAAAAASAAASAAAALADANRAELFGASTGVMAYAGSITAQSYATISCADGTYLIIYLVEDSGNSSGINLVKLANSQVQLKNRSIITNGTGVPVPMQVGTVADTGLQLRNQTADGDMYYLVIGRAE